MASEFDILAQLKAIEKSQQEIGAQAPVADFDLESAWINYGKSGYEYTIADKITKIYVTESMDNFGLTGWFVMVPLLVKNFFT